ncbi:hypothetical protein [Mycoplana sp. MJR14]|uniref:hypothetical protein n=1 Tax=Mycoplana sp. MJR14 TaxID=3032583 RepID=UPI0023DCB290|nr:hypothetical protein [Mycoplana sp. MJR14]MDF1634545.1 hypothetical protein [Mycoplana sp. MJR14]
MTRNVMPQCNTQTTFQNGFFGPIISPQRKGGKPMGITHSLNVLMISAAFLFVASMIFI